MTVQRWKWCAACLACNLVAASSAWAINFGAVMLAGNYPGGPTFDDNLQPSRDALAASFALWPNWQRGPGGNIVELPGNTGAQGFLNAITNRGNMLGAGDLLVVFYFGHGGWRANAENPPALNSRDEQLVLGDNSKITDDAMAATLNGLNPGLYKLFINISCFSGGFWGGNDAGDLERVPRTILMRSSREDQLTYTGGLAPRPNEPLYLRNLIFTARTNAFRSILTWHLASAVFGSAINANRFGEQGDEEEDIGDDIWGQEYSGDFDAMDFDTMIPMEEFETIGVPAPAAAGLAALTAAFLARRRERGE